MFIYFLLTVYYLQKTFGIRSC